MMETASTLQRRTGVERWGIPAALFWGYIAVLIFMIGDGVESNYLAPYFTRNGFSIDSAATIIAFYGVTVTVGSWLAGSLSTLLGPRKVMLAGGAIWVIFEVLFLAFALPSKSFLMIALTYGLRGIAYPMFAYAFLVWIQAAAPSDLKGAATGWFWLAFTGGLPTLGSLVAVVSIGMIGEYPTFWLSLGLVACGVLIAAFAIREPRGRAPFLDEAHSGKSTTHSAWRYRHSLAASAHCRRSAGAHHQHSALLRLLHLSAVFLHRKNRLHAAAIPFADHDHGPRGHELQSDRRTDKRPARLAARADVLRGYWLGHQHVAHVLRAAIHRPQFRNRRGLRVPLRHHAVRLCPGGGAMSSLAGREDKGNAMAIYCLSAGVSTFIGPVLYRVLNSAVGMDGVVWTYAVLYVISALVSWFFLVSPEDPGELRGASNRRDALERQTLPDANGSR